MNLYQRLAAVIFGIIAAAFIFVFFNHGLRDALTLTAIYILILVLCFVATCWVSRGDK